MKRKQKIIFYVTSIILITLVLIGFTYGYYMTNITGNTNTKSIEVQAGHSNATFTDLSEDNLSTVVEPGYTYTKLFTVQNTGNLKAKYSIYLMDVLNTFIRTEDITYTLYRNAGNNTIDISNLDNYTIVKTGEFPKTEALILADEEITNSNDFYTYALKIDYLNLPGIDQSDDMEHVFSGNVQIYGASNYLNPYTEGTLAYNIINNALNNTNNTLYRKTPLTIPAQAISLENESELIPTEDDLGTSYYFRGNVQNNYLNFNNMCWRIVRIEGDGSIKLVLSDKDSLCSSETNNKTNSSTVGIADYGYDDSGNNNYNSNGETSMKTLLNVWYNSYIMPNQSYLKKDNWCIQQTIINSANLKCTNSSTISEYIASLTSDEVMLAGATTISDNLTFYLKTNVSGPWRLLSYAENIVGAPYTANVYTMINGSFNMDNGTLIRPSIVLRKNILSTGSGTLSSPYVVS